MLKKVLITLLVFSLAGCTQTTQPAGTYKGKKLYTTTNGRQGTLVGKANNKTSGKKGNGAQALGQAIGAGLIVGGMVLGAAAIAGPRHYSGPRYRASPGRGPGRPAGSNGCAPMYASSTPTNTWGPGSMCLGN